MLGYIDAVRLVLLEQLAEMATITYQGPDAVMGVKSAWAFGYSWREVPVGACVPALPREQNAAVPR